MKASNIPMIRVAVLAVSMLLTHASLADEVKTINIPRQPVVGTAPVTQSLIVTEVSQPKGIMILLPGGSGKLNVAVDNKLSINANNFLIRSRFLLAGEGFHTVVMDAASDFLQLPGGLRNQRRTIQHMTDIATVIGFMRLRYGDLPVWLVGTSRGSIAAANAASVLPASPIGPDGVVLTATVTRPNINNDDSIQRVPVNQINIPVLIAHHEDDACGISPAEDIETLSMIIRDVAPKVKVKLFGGGLQGIEGPCDALTPHGFLGIEHRVTRYIAKETSKLLKKKSLSEESE